MINADVEIIFLNVFSKFEFSMMMLLNSSRIIAKVFSIEESIKRFIKS